MTKYIRNIENVKEICACNIDTAKYHVIESNEAKARINIGFYTRINMDLYGVMESHKGPIFFHNDKLYLLSDLDYKFIHQHLEPKLGKFELIVAGKKKEEVIYRISEFTDYDSWTSEKDIDFFQWICQSQEDDVAKRRFHEYYTKI